MGGVGWVGSDWEVKSSSFNFQGTTKTFNTNRDKFASGLRLTLGAAQRMNRILLGLEGKPRIISMHTIFNRIKCHAELEDF